MKHNVYSVYDYKAGAWLLPFFQPTRGLAIRAFTAVASDPQHHFHRYPLDYCLYEIGVFDDNTGETVMCQPVISLGTPKEYQAQAELPLESDLFEESDQ